MADVSYAPIEEQIKVLELMEASIPERHRASSTKNVFHRLVSSTSCGPNRHQHRSLMLSVLVMAALVMVKTSRLFVSQQAIPAVQQIQQISIKPSILKASIVPTTHVARATSLMSSVSAHANTIHGVEVHDQMYFLTPRTDIDLASARTDGDTLTGLYDYNLSESVRSIFERLFGNNKRIFFVSAGNSTEGTYNIPDKRLAFLFLEKKIVDIMKDEKLDRSQRPLGYWGAFVTDETYEPKEFGFMVQYKSDIVHAGNLAFLHRLQEKFGRDSVYEFGIFYDGRGAVVTRKEVVCCVEEVAGSEVAIQLITAPRDLVT